MSHAIQILIKEYSSSDDEARDRQDHQDPIFYSTDITPEDENDSAVMSAPNVLLNKERIVKKWHMRALQQLAHLKKERFFPEILDEMMAVRRKENPRNTLDEFRYQRSPSSHLIRTRSSAIEQASEVYSPRK